MSYVILFIVGLLIGAGFLVVLLIGDRKEARREAQKKVMQEQRTQAGQAVEGAWPPPPSASTLPDPVPSAPTQNPAATRAATRKMVQTFYLVRNYVSVTVVLAFILYSSFSRYNFGWVLLATASAVAVVWGVSVLVRRSKRPPDRFSGENGEENQ